MLKPMFTARNIVSLLLFALILPGCEREAGFPDVAGSISAEGQSRPWPGFLPLAAVLGDEPVDISKSTAEIRTLEYRISNLQRRAIILKAPLIDVQHRLRMQQALFGRD